MTDRVKGAIVEFEPSWFSHNDEDDLPAVLDALRALRSVESVQAVITFDHDIRDDDVEFQLQAIRRMRHVQKVTPLVCSLDDLMNRTRISREFRDKILKMLDEMGH